MGKFSNGIFGNFHGKIGQVVGFKWRGTDYLRSLPKVNKNRVLSEAQVEQRARFGLITRFLTLVRPVLEIGYRKAVSGPTAYNLALSDNIKNAISGIYPAFEIDYSMVSLSRGLPVFAAASPAVAVAAGRKVNFTWVDDSPKGKARDTDTVVALVYCPATGGIKYSLGEATRKDAALSITLPEEFEGKEIETYLFWISTTGKDVSSTVYGGKLTVLA